MDDVVKVEEVVEYKRPQAIDAFGPFKRVGLDTGSESNVQQHFLDDCDITKIMKRYYSTGLLSHINPYKPQYGDFSNVGDFHSALNAVREAEEYFMTFPAKFRERFANDPAKFLDYLNDPANSKELQELGILEKPVEASSEVIHGTASAPSDASETAGG